MKTITLSRSGHTVNADSDRDVMRVLAQSLAKIAGTGPLDGLTDQSGGTASKIVHLPLPLAATAVSGSNLATVGDVTSSLETVRNALKTMFVRANAAAIVLGFNPVTYGGGGTDGAGTVAALDMTVAGATTGAGRDLSNALIQRYNNAIYNLAILVNRVAEAVGDDSLVVNPENASVSAVGNIPGLTTDPGTATNTNAVSAASWAATLTTWANSLASIAALVNTVTTPGAVRVVAIR